METALLKCSTLLAHEYLSQHKSCTHFSWPVPWKVSEKERPLPKIQQCPPLLEWNKPLTCSPTQTCCPAFLPKAICPSLQPTLPPISEVPRTLETFLDSGYTYNLEKD